MAKEKGAAESLIEALNASRREEFSDKNSLKKRKSHQFLAFCSIKLILELISN